MPEKPTITDQQRQELAERIERMRRLCEHLDSALSGAIEQRELISKMKAEADALRTSLFVHKNRFEGT